MHPIRVGIQIQQQHATYPQIRDAWKRVDESGADTLWNWDHFFPLSGTLTARTSTTSRRLAPWPR
ncbi:MAG: hypothetical protein U0075_10570 [Thermomicrobiales bacterium]